MIEERTIVEFLNRVIVPFFMAGLTVGMTYMALRGKLDRLFDAVGYIHRRVDGVERKLEKLDGKVDSHMDRHVA
jgi:hypothetical protein